METINQRGSNDKETLIETINQRGSNDKATLMETIIINLNQQK